VELKFAPKKPPQKKPAAPKPPPGTPPPAVKATEEGKAVPHKLVKIARIAAFLGVDIRIIHGYVRRGSLKAVYPSGSTVKHVYADEAAAVVRRSSSSRGGPAHVPVTNRLLSWDKGDGRKEVGWVQPSNGKSLVEIQRASNGPFVAILEDLEKRVHNRTFFLEKPKGVVALLVKYLEVTQPGHPSIVALKQALGAFKEGS
jgi:hypothetical protein